MLTFDNIKGAKVTIVLVDRSGKLRFQPIGTRGIETVLRKTHIQPVGVIVHGKVMGDEKYGVFYKGRNVEVLGAIDIDHPHIKRIEQSLHQHGLKMEAAMMKAKQKRMLAKKYYSEYDNVKDAAPKKFEPDFHEIVFGKPKRMLAEKYYSATDPTEANVDPSWTTRKTGKGRRAF